MATKLAHTFAEGRELAIEMLAQFEASEDEDADQEIAEGYLAQLVERADPSLTAGFASVLGHYLGIAGSGCTTSSRIYREASSGAEALQHRLRRD